jgi:hypothetical protein
MKAMLRGQSMTEFAVAVAALGALLLGSVSVVGLQEVQRRGIIAAREAAFQAEWSRQREDTRAIRERISIAHYNDPGLTNPTGTSRLLGPDDVELSVQRTPAPGRGASASELLFRPLRAAGGYMGGEFDLADEGFLTGMVSATLSGSRRMPEPFNQLRLQFDQPFALLGDDWSAAGPAHVQRRSSGLVPTHVLTPLASTWRPLAAPLSLFEPAIRNLCLGLVEPERVPEDRLGPGPAQGTPTCP